MSVARLDDGPFGFKALMLRNTKICGWIVEWCGEAAEDAETERQEAFCPD
jgi:hypothetical protein